MARIPYPETQELSDQVATRLAQLPPLNILRMLAHAQTNFVPFLSLGAAILTEQDLDAKLRELAILRVAHLTGAHYEWTQHEPIARQCGATDAQIAAISAGGTAAVFNEVERHVLQFTDELTLDVRVSDATFQALAQHLPARQLVELTLAASFYGLAARIMEVFRIELEASAGTYTIAQLQARSSP